MSQMSLSKKIAYGRKVLPGGTWRALSAPVREPVHLMMAVADHFEPAIDPEDGQKRVPLRAGAAPGVVGPRVSESRGPLARP
jgi:hypothetical protein